MLSFLGSNNTNLKLDIKAHTLVGNSLQTYDKGNAKFGSVVSKML